MALDYSMQQRVGEWADMTFGSPAHVPLCAHINRIEMELGELADEVLDETVGEVRVNGQMRARIAKEAADVYITLLRLCWLLDIDLDSVTDEKQSINEKRKWKSNGDGTGHHIKEEE